MRHFIGSTVVSKRSLDRTVRGRIVNDRHLIELIRDNQKTSPLMGTFAKPKTRQTNTPTVQAAIKKHHW